MCFGGKNRKTRYICIHLSSCTHWFFSGGDPRNQPTGQRTWSFRRNRCWDPIDSTWPGRPLPHTKGLLRTRVRVGQKCGPRIARICQFRSDLQVPVDGFLHDKAPWFHGGFKHQTWGFNHKDDGFTMKIYWLGKKQVVPSRLLRYCIQLISSKIMQIPLCPCCCH